MRNIKNVAIATTLSLLLVPTLQSVNLNAEETTSTYEQKAQEAGRTPEQLQATFDEQQTPSKTRSKASALETAKSYQSWAHMSKASLYDQLIYEGYSADEANYAVINVGSNWNNEAYLTAKSYMDTQCVGNMCDYWSKQGLHDQLTSKYGEQFTSSQADYAINKLNCNWKSNALKQAKIFKSEKNSSTYVRSMLEEYEFSTSNINYAMNTLFPETWSTTKTYTVKTGKTHGKNSTYIEDYKKNQKSSNGRTRTIRYDYKKGTYDANGHTKTWENWNYDSNGTWTTKTVTTYKWNPVTKKEVVYKVTKYQNGKGVTSNKVTPTTWSTKKTYKVKSGKSHGKNATYIEDYKKDQVSNFGSKRTIRYDYKKGTYDSKGHTKTWENWDYNSSGKYTAKKLTKYSYINKKERVINNDNKVYKTAGNGKTGVHTYYKNTKYFSNGKVKSFSQYSYYSGSNQASKNVYNEFYSNGKKKICQDKYYSKSGKLTSIHKNTYNSKGSRTSHYVKNY